MSEQIQSPQRAPLFNTAFIADPYSLYHRLRATDPMHLTPFGYHVASRHADVAAILRDKRFGKDFMRRPALMFKEPIYRSMSHWIVHLDPPNHGRLRNLLIRAFTARRIEDMRPRIQQIVDEIIDGVEPRGHMDLMADFAFRLPLIVICDLLGIPQEDRQIFFTSSRARFARLFELTALSRAEVDQQNSHNLAMAEYFGRLFELRRREPGDDIITYLVQAEEYYRLTNEELTANVIMLFDAGHETTVSLIGNGLLALHRNPDQLRLLKNDPSLMANAIEELLRYDAPVQAIGRTALEYVDEIGGISLEKGQSVICLVGSANRDPAVYSDPDRLDVTRPNVRPLSFGSGIHQCVGAQLARIEGEIAIATLLRRLPDLQVLDVDHPDWRQTFVLRGLNKLLASW